jgi:uncharacterized protein (DUF1800 family)
MKYMSLSPKAMAYIALNRFGFGAAQGDLRRVLKNGGAHKWLDSQIKRGAIGAGKLKGSFEGSPELLERWQKAQVTKNKELIRNVRKEQREAFQQEMYARTDQAIISEYAFAERLVHFWSNHFTISGKSKAIIVGMMGAYEREAIRPYIFSNFEDLLFAVETHPAMLLYLDNNQSIGPKSNGGKRRNRGLNENLAREILELHTLGVNGGYTQRDVTEFAKIITGWGITGAKQEGERGYRFNLWAHEPGPKYLLGRQYGSPERPKDREQAEFLARQEGRMALQDIARHPSTAKFIATKLARHFIADNPPAAAVKKLEETFLKTKGDLSAVYKTLVSLKEIWEEPFPKYKTPYEYVITIHKMLGLRVNELRQQQQLRQTLNMMDHVPFMALSPAGWGDTQGDWLSPDALMNRVDWAHAVAGRVQQQFDDPLIFAQETMGDILNDREIATIKAAPSKADGIALTLLCPAVIRR